MFAARAISFALLAAGSVSALTEVLDIPPIAAVGVSVEKRDLDIVGAAEGALDTPLAAVEGVADGAIDLGKRDIDLGLGAAADAVASIPKRHARRHERRAVGDELSSIFTDLTSSLAPVLSTLNETVADVTSPVESIVSTVESQLGSLKTLLGGALSSVSGIGGLKRRQSPDEAVAQLAGSTLATVFTTLQTVNSAVGSIPELGPVVEPALTELEGVLSNLVSTTGQLLGPVVNVLNNLLAPLTPVLNDLGLGSITGVLNGLL